MPRDGATGNAKRGPLLFVVYFLLFSLMMGATRLAFSPEAPMKERFVPGAGEIIDEGLRDRLRAARALRALDAVTPPHVVSANPALASAAQLVVMAIPAERGIPDRFLKALEKVAYAPAMARIALPLHVAVDYGRTEPRGTYADGTVTVAALDGLSEMIKVLTHEIGHRADMVALVSGTGGKDPSDDFYAFSWQDVRTKKKGSRAADFVSGYAQTNRYEDFAESFTFYVFHNREFTARALRNDALRAKYGFFRGVVFPEGAYVGTSFADGALPSYLWDTTKAPIDVAKYLKYADQ